MTDDRDPTPWGCEQDGVPFSLWSGMERRERIIWSPVYLIVILILWFRGIFIGEDFHFVPMRESDSEVER